MGNEGDDEVLTTEQVQARYKISRTALWRLKRDGILVPIEQEDTPLLTRAHTNHYRKSDIERAAQVIAQRRKGRKPKDDGQP